MISKKLESAINKQINEELYSAYLYAAMLAYFESENLKGLAQWMRVQVQEEMFHATKFFNYISTRGGRNELEAIAKPQKEWKSPLDAFEAAYKHEQHITACINGLVTLARKEEDYATETFLQWYVTEQVEEEMNTSEISGKIKLMGKSTEALYMLDKELGARTYTPPAQTQA